MRGQNEGITGEESMENVLLRSGEEGQMTNDRQREKAKNSTTRVKPAKIGGGGKEVIISETSVRKEHAESNPRRKRVKKIRDWSRYNGDRRALRVSLLQGRLRGKRVRAAGKSKRGGKESGEKIATSSKWTGATNRESTKRTNDVLKSFYEGRLSQRREESLNS